MILSHKHRLIFVKGRKVASTSVELALSRICGPDDVITPLSPVDEKLRIDDGHPPRNFAPTQTMELEYVRQIRELPADRLHEAELQPMHLRFWNHMPLAEVERRADVPLDGYLVVGVERHPYEKAISLANWMRQATEYRRGRPITFDLAQTRLALDLLIRDGRILQCRNIDLYRRLDGRIDLTTMRFETVDDDFARLMEHLRVPPPIPMLPHVKKGNWGARPIDVLSMSQIAAINELFKEEFAFFGHPAL